jgi:hypothetical protein
VAARKVLVTWLALSGPGGSHRLANGTLAGAGRSESDFEERTGRMGTKGVPILLLARVKRTAANVVLYSVPHVQPAYAASSSWAVRT